MLRSLRIVAPALAFAVLACASSRSSTQRTNGGSTSGAQAANSSTAPAPRLVCRTERPTGSNIPRRVCYSEEQLDEMSRAAQDAHRKATQSAAQPVHD